MSDLNPYEEGLALELQTAQKRIKALTEQLAAARRDAEKAEALLGRLMEAGQPFADAADECDEWGHDDENQAPVSAGDCRVFRNILNKETTDD